GNAAYDFRRSAARSIAADLGNDAYFLGRQQERRNHGSLEQQYRDPGRSGGAANGVAAAATNGQLSANAPAWVQIQIVQGGSLGSASGIQVVVKDSNGT